MVIITLLLMVVTLFSCLAAVILLLSALFQFLIFTVQKKQKKYYRIPQIQIAISLVLFIPLFLILTLNVFNENESKKRYGDLYYFSQNGDWDKVKRLVNRGYSVDGEYEITPLVHACYVGNIEMVHFLVENGADVNSSLKWNTNPLMSASTTWHSNDEKEVRIAEYLISNGAILNNRVLNDACGNSNLILVEYYINTNVFDNRDLTEALETACRERQYENAKYLISCGADINGIDIKYISILNEHLDK